MKSVQRSIRDEVVHIHPSPQSLLDIGCGNGFFTQVLAHSLPHTAITAVDLTLPRNPAGLNGIRFVEGGVENLPFDSNLFDVVTASMSMHHWNNKEQGITEIYRVLKEGGRMVIGDPLLQDWLSNPFLGRLVQKIDGGVFAVPQELRAYLESAGFEAVSIQVVPHSLKSVYLITATKP